MRRRRRLTAIIAVALVLTAPLIASSPAAQTTLPNRAATALTPDVLGKRGHDRETPAIISNALGLTATNQTWPSREVAALDDRPHYLHGFAINRGDDRDIAFSIRSPNSIRAFRVHRDGQLVSALVEDLRTGQVTVRSPAEAQADLDIELAFWVAGVNIGVSNK